MVEDYRIYYRTGRAERTGTYEITMRGTKREKSRYVERYMTPVGELLPEIWREKAMEEIRKAGELDLLERIKDHCREWCGWLRKETEIEDYAISCLCSRAYTHWERFEGTEEIIWM